jgi:hypothetical protein
MSKIRHKWELQKIGEKTKCLKCSLIKESLGWNGGFMYYFEEHDFYFFKTTSCGQEVTKKILIDSQPTLKKYKLVYD